MSNEGTARVANLVWDNTLKTWVREPNPEDVMQTINISGITPVGGKLPVDTEITVEGDVVVEDIKIKSAPLTEVFPSGIYAQIVTADDLVTTIQYNESDARTTVSGISYSSSALGTNVLETFVSGVNTLTITRS